MAFIDTSETIVGIEIVQIDSRFVAPGQPVEFRQIAILNYVMPF